MFTLTGVTVRASYAYVLFLMKINLINLNFLILLHIFKIVPSFINLLMIKKNQLIISVEYYSIYLISFFFKRYSNTQINYLSDITGVDLPQQISRFEIVYNFLSINFNSRLRIKTSIHELISLNSLALIFLSASWFERELWDMFGIYFFEHFRLRRILTDYGFFGYPLRKEFPTSGFLEVRYDEETQKVIYEAVQFTCLGRFLKAS